MVRFSVVGVVSDGVGSHSIIFNQNGVKELAYAIIQLPTQSYLVIFCCRSLKVFATLRHDRAKIAEAVD